MGSKALLRQLVEGQHANAQLSLKPFVAAVEGLSHANLGARESLRAGASGGKLGLQAQPALLLLDKLVTLGNSRNWRSCSSVNGSGRSVTGPPSVEPCGA